MAKKGEAYKKKGSLFDDVIVEEVTEDRVNFREVVGWSYGWPALGNHHSASHKSFERNYEKIDPVDGVG